MGRRCISAFAFAFAFMGCGPEVSGPDDSGGVGSRDDGADEGEDGEGAEGARDGGRDDGGRGDGEDGVEDGKDDVDDAGKDDPYGESIRTCFSCWKDDAQGCEREINQCWDDLACTQLMDCPTACEFSRECIAECNEIIPSGVEPLTAAVQCMVCNDGPCAADCDNEWIQSYCG